MRALFLSAFVAAAALVAAPGASADLAEERELAERYAPVVRLVEQEEECGYGEPYEPVDVDILFDERTVALRGPWNPVDLVKIAPRAADLDELYLYHLDFPGNALDPGCDYERWGRRIGEGSEPTVYAHVVGDPGHPGMLALQYWLFYVYNDWNNLHEGDWEMIQLVFEARDAREALSQEPVSVGYSQHEGGEAASWDDEKLELVDGRHPVVYPAAGSHANFFDEALYVGSSAQQGVGCDDTRGPHDELRPEVKTISSEAGAAREAFPWIGYEGRWGELQEAFFNGPTGPNDKLQWTEPIAWSEEWRDRAYGVPTGGALGTSATDFFCEAVAAGSVGLIKLLRDPVPVLIAIAVLLGLLIFAAVKATWTPVAPVRVGRRRTWGQILSSASRMYVGQALLFLGIGLLLIPIVLVITLLQGLLIAGIGGDGEGAGALVLVSLLIGTTLTLLGLAFVQAATVCALVRVDDDRDVNSVEAYRLALTRARALLGASGLLAAAWITLSATGIGLPIAVWLGVRWSLAAQVVEVEGLRAVDALRRSGELVRGRWLKVASLVGVGTAVAIAAGPLLGALLILLTDAPLALLNIVAGVVYALTMPFVALVTAYMYFDARTKHELEPADEPDELPAEIEVRPAT